MPRPQYERNGLKLPQSLQQELGLELPRPKDSVPHPKRNGLLGRKEKRHSERQEKKALRAQSSVREDTRRRGRVQDETPVMRKQRPKMQHKKLSDKQQFPADSLQQPKSILKKPTKAQLPTPEKDSDSDDGSLSERSQSPGLVIDRNSKNFRDRSAQDDADIAALEKRLGVKGRKAPKVFNDGLDDLLDGLDDYLEEDSTKKRKREADDWLNSKRRKAATSDILSSEEDEDGAFEEALDEDSEEDSDDGMGYGVEDMGTDLSDAEAEVDGDDFESFESEDEDGDITQETSKKRENPYVAPVAPGSTSAPKYVPPSLRKSSTSVDESTQRLRRQLQGHINKLSEANIISIVTEIEKLYQTNARQSVTSMLIELLLTPFCEPAQLQNTFVILHAAFISAIYKLIGTDFGAQIIAELVDRFEKFYGQRSEQSSKEALNLISLLSYLYTFTVIGSVLVFDYIRLFLNTLSESNTELLLKMVRDCGPQLRQDDPSSLKDIVLIMQGTIAKAQSEGCPISVRTKFMVETITDLKNNKLKSGAAGTTVAIDHITRMRKVLGSLNSSRVLKASEPLRIGLEDIKNSDQRGKWWLVGASWKEKDIQELPREESWTDQYETMQDPGETDLIALAQQHRMNTSIRRSIFIAIMSASDFRDAQLRLTKLRLKKAQELEIPRVLLHCSGSEDAYNPYYTLIAKQLCSTNKKMRMAFQFALWSFFKRIGEKPDDEEEDDEEVENVELKEIVNLAKMYGQLIADGTLTLAVLKTLNLVYLKDQAKIFVEVVLITIITRCQSSAANSLDQQPLLTIFSKAIESQTLAKGLQYFVRKILSKTDLTSTKKEARTVKSACTLIVPVLEPTNLPINRMEEADDDDDFA